MVWGCCWFVWLYDRHRDVVCDIVSCVGILFKSYLNPFVNPHLNIMLARLGRSWLCREADIVKLPVGNRWRSIGYYAQRSNKDGFFSSYLGLPDFGVDDA